MLLHQDSVMERMGPFKHKQMLKWLDRGYFGGDDPKLPVQHQGTGVWVPVWYLAVASGHAGADCDGSHVRMFLWTNRAAGGDAVGRPGDGGG